MVLAFFCKVLPNITLVHEKLKDNKTMERQTLRYQQKEVTAKDKQGDTLRLLSLRNSAEYTGMLLGLHGDCCCSFRNPQAELHLGGVGFLVF